MSDLESDAAVLRAVAEQALDLARVAIRSAEEAVQASSAAREQRRFWTRIAAEWAADPSLPGVCCSYCGRFRARDRSWGDVPQLLGEWLRGGEGARMISHGICPGCVVKHLGGLAP